jgi:hypothetical protein
LTNIAAFDLVRVGDQFPGGVKARLGRLVLPELEVERPVKFGQFAVSLDESRSHLQHDDLGMPRRRRYHFRVNYRRPATAQVYPKVSRVHWLFLPLAVRSMPLLDRRRGHAGVPRTSSPHRERV